MVLLKIAKNRCSRPASHVRLRARWDGKRANSFGIFAQSPAFLTHLALAARRWAKKTVLSAPIAFVGRRCMARFWAVHGA